MSHQAMSAVEAATELRRLVEKPDQVDATAKTIAAHSYDWWPVAAKWRQNDRSPCTPDVVVFPESVEDISKIAAWANEAGVPVTAWGLGSSVVGQPLAVNGGISLDLSRMDKIIAVDEVNLIVRAQAGVVGGKLEEHLNALGFTLNHSPQSLHRSTVGGWLATRATGQFSSRYGGIEDLCYSLEAVLADGGVLTTADTPRMAVGPDLRHTMIGSEGCLGIISEVALKIFPLPEQRLYETIAFTSVENGVLAIRAMMMKGLRPFLLRLYDLEEARHAMKDKSYASPVMFLGCEGVQAVAAAELKACADVCAALGGKLQGAKGAEGWMGRRYDFSTIEGFVSRPEGVAETIEVSNNWSRIMETYTALTERLRPMAAEVLGHFSHAYTTGISLYVIVLGEAADSEQSEARIMDIWTIAMNAALETGASISHHHGAGLARAPYVTRSLGSSFELLQRLKHSLDPNSIFNPGKLGLKRP